MHYRSESYSKNGTRSGYPGSRSRRHRRQLAAAARAASVGPVAGVVKADAYGLGARQVAPALLRRRLPAFLRRPAG